ncbi:MAG: thermonuclease family protein [Enhygromyxa sp.]
MLLLPCLGCTAEPDEQGRCGPSEATVARVIDGDTIDLDSGERVRYLMIDTPEITNTPECWGLEAKQANQALVEGKTVRLRYDVECEDDYGRLLAYVELQSQVINRVLVERGHACVMQISPNGEDLLDEYRQLEYAAEQLGKGMWAVCNPIPCKN